MEVKEVKAEAPPSLPARTDIYAPLDTGYNPPSTVFYEMMMGLTLERREKNLGNWQGSITRETSGGKDGSKLRAGNFP